MRSVTHSRSSLVFGFLVVVAVPAMLMGQTWEPAPALPTVGAPRTHAAGVNHQGIIYALGGTPWQNGGDMDGSVHRLLPGAATWETVSPLSGMGPVVSQAAGVDSLGRIIVYGGFILGDGGPGEEKEYGPIDGPTGNMAARDVPEPAIGYFAWARDDQGRLYGLGGGLGAGESNSGYCDRYDASTNTWQTLPTMPTPVADACAAYDGAGHILVFGGINAGGTARVANVARYDIATNSWSDVSVPDLPVVLSGARAALGADGRIHVAGGETGSLGAGVTQSTVYKLEPSTNSWTTVASMTTPRRHFALVLGGDDYLYAIGGDNNSGGTSTVEKRFTPRCPSFARHPEELSAWSGSIAVFSVDTTGATPLSYAWRKDDVVLVDGATATGSAISGATTPALVISNPGDLDAGNYDCVATNACGSTQSDAALLTILTPPEVPTNWVVTNIHPGWAQSSSVANGVSNGRIGGSATTPTLLPDGRTLALDHPVVWTGPSWSPADLTPAGSVGGGILDVKNDLMVGWYWHTFSCYAGGQWWTCGWQSASSWSGISPVFDEAVHSSGPEYDSAGGTDGQQFVGTLTYEYTEGNYTSFAYLWSSPSQGHSLHPSGVANSFAGAVDGNRQYGTIHTPYPGPVAHAAMWSGTAATFVDMHPAAYSRSSISGAGDGQAVGTAYIGDTGHALLWAGGPAAVVDLHPTGAGGSSATDVEGGLQVGSVAGRAALWRGSAESYFDLGAAVPSGMTASGANGVEVAADGTITVVGYAYNPSSARYEALVWRSVPGLPGDVNCDGFVDLDDAQVIIDVLLELDLTACHVEAADLDASGSPDGRDVQPMIDLLLSP